mgnify:CR=1 FL=1
MRYRRFDKTGGTYFFPVNQAKRNADTLVRHSADLREAMNNVKATHPFAVVAMVVLPEHRHAIWRLPPEDAGYPAWWSWLKAGFSGRLDKVERLATEPRGQTRARHRAATVLGASDSGWARPGAARRVHPLQPGEAWLGETLCELAALDAARVHRPRHGGT